MANANTVFQWNMGFTHFCGNDYMYMHSIHTLIYAMCCILFLNKKSEKGRLYVWIWTRYMMMSMSMCTTMRSDGLSKLSTILTQAHPMFEVHCVVKYLRVSLPPGGGGRGGGTDSLSLSTNCETTALLFSTKDRPCFATSKFTAPSFHG